MARRNQSSRNFDIWPGFVDALSGLLIIFVIVSMIFMTAQFFLGEELAGRDKTIDQLTAQIAALSEELSFEQEKSERAEARAEKAEKTITDMARELQTALLANDQLADDKASLEKSVTDLRGKLAVLEKDSDALRGQVGLLRADREGMLIKLGTLEKDKEALLLRIAILEKEANRLALQLADAVKASKEADTKAVSLGKKLATEIERLQAENDRLKKQLATETAARKSSEGRDSSLSADARTLAGQVAALEAEKQSLEDRLATITRQLSAIEADNKRLAAQVTALIAARTAAGNRIADLTRARDDMDSRAETLAKRISELEEENRRLAEQLAAARKEGAGPPVRTADLAKRRTALEQEKADLLRRVAELEKLNSQLRTNLTSALRDRKSVNEATDTLRQNQAKLIARLATVERERNRLRELLAAARVESRGLGRKLVEADKRFGAARKASKEQTRQLWVLNAQLVALRRQLSSIQSALEAAEAKGKLQRLQIRDLNERLKKALIQQVNELKQYKSEFFGELRKSIGKRKDVKIVGDRFVFPSSVLFPSGSDKLQQGGKAELRKVAKTLNEIMKKIPTEIDWILRVDGHTDVRRYLRSSNLELSTRRAIAVVNFLREAGIPAKRLFAAGFGSHHPIDLRQNEEAFQRNRRIEIKLTQR